MRGVWLGAGAVLTVLALFLATGAIWAGFARARPPTEQTTRTIPFAGKKLKIEVSGDVDVQVTPGNAGEVRLDRRTRWSQTKPRTAEDWTGTTLRLAAECPGVEVEKRGRVCSAHYTVFVPTEADLDVTAASGSLAVDNLYGDVRLSSLSGTLTVGQLAGSLWARSGSGDIRANDLRGEVADVETGEGRIDLLFRDRPMNVRAVVRTEGAVHLNVADGAYDVRAQGLETDIDVVHDPTSSRKITVIAPHGRVDVCCG